MSFYIKTCQEPDFLAMMMSLDHGHMLVKRHTYLHIVKKYHANLFNYTSPYHFYKH